MFSSAIKTGVASHRPYSAVQVYEPLTGTEGSNPSLTILPLGNQVPEPIWEGSIRRYPFQGRWHEVERNRTK
jgi:hypothetical protein